MNAAANLRKCGRPRLDAPSLSRERIVSTAMHLVATGTADLSMRAVAAALGVNAMAAYHYFDSKQALLDAMIDEAFAPMLPLAHRMRKLPTAELRLKLLASTYLRCAAKALPLTRHLAARGGTPLTTVFDTLFDIALGAHTQDSVCQIALRDVLVDYLHGVALAGPKSASKAFLVGWPVLMQGMRPHFLLNPRLENGPR